MSALAEVIEPRSINHIMADLLRLTIEGEWSGRSNTSCHCHPEYQSSCPECDELYEDGKHKPNCKRLLLIRETQAYLRVEWELAEARGEQGVYFDES